MAVPPLLSVPSETLIPLSSMSATRAVPDLRLKLLFAQCEIPDPRTLMRSSSEEERWTQWARTVFWRRRRKRS